MKLKNTLTEYGAISRIFHWLSATVLIIQIPLGMYLVDMDFSEKRLTIENIHVAVGISIFYLTVLRLIYKAFNPTPKLNNSIFPGQKIIAKLNHVFLYISILMITINQTLEIIKYRKLCNQLSSPFSYHHLLIPYAESDQL